MFLFLKEFSRLIIKGRFPAISGFRYRQRWKALLNKSPLDAKQPWITFRAIDFIEQHLSAGAKVFEFGGGGSTLFFLGKASEIVTVEHDEAWFKLLRDKISGADAARWKGQFIPAEKTGDTKGLDKANPADYYSEDVNFAGSIFKSYSSFIDRFEDGYFDLVLIDGRSRTSCLYHSIPKVKIGGYLVLDNSERSYYLTQNAKHLEGRYKLLVNQEGPVPYTPFFSKTAIWQRVK